MVLIYIANNYDCYVHFLQMIYFDMVEEVRRILNISSWLVRSYSSLLAQCIMIISLDIPLTTTAGPTQQYNYKIIIQLLTINVLNDFHFFHDSLHCFYDILHGTGYL